MDLARSLGADHVIDYTREDPLAGSEARYDLILAVNGYQPIAAYRRALRPGGIYVMGGGSAAQVFQAMLLGAWTFRTGDRKFSQLETKPSQEDLAFVAELIEAGQVVPVIDRCYPLEEVPQAIRHLEAGHTRGKLVIGVAG
jgi:NADPH:quinone reductase-like Zn-dependent oxidoreductase